MAAVRPWQKTSGFFVTLTEKNLFSITSMSAGSDDI
jgi:hypothetical protein